MPAASPPPPERPDVLLLRRSTVTGSWDFHVVGMENALLKLGVPGVHRLNARWKLAPAQALNRLGLARQYARLKRRRVLTCLGWGSAVWALPDGLIAETVPWISDCWAPDFPKWQRLLQRLKIRQAFFSARACAEHFRTAVAGLETHWLPEAADPAWFDPSRPLTARAIHLTEMGRRMRPFHNKVRKPLAEAGKVHAYTSQGPNAWRLGMTAEELRRGLADTAVLACFPKTLTHPQADPGVETVTLRYFEGMGSGCLIYGHAPDELVDLFGYNPVVEMDANDPVGQFFSLLDQLPSYQPLVDRNLQRLREVATFDVRARSWLDALRKD